MLQEIKGKILDITQDQYGNYVIQNLISKLGSSSVYFIYPEIKGKIFDLSIHKYASNVVEKCYTNGDSKIQKLILDEILCKDDQNR
jgi:hypothetical protein